MEIPEIETVGTPFIIQRSFIKKWRFRNVVSVNETFSVAEKKFRSVDFIALIFKFITTIDCDNFTSKSKDITKLPCNPIVSIFLDFKKEHKEKKRRLVNTGAESGNISISINWLSKIRLYLMIIKNSKKRFICWRVQSFLAYFMNLSQSQYWTTTTQLYSRGL